MSDRDVNQTKLHPIVKKPPLEQQPIDLVATAAQTSLPKSPLALSKSEPVKVKVWPKFLGWGAAVLATVIVLAAMYIQPWAETATVVTVETVRPGPLTRLLAVNGKIAALHSIDVRSTVSGRLQSITTNVGDTVKPGDVLARIESAQQEAVVRQALAGLDAGLVALAQATANMQRDQALGANVSRAALEDAKRKAQSAEQEVVRLTALFDQAQIALAFHTVTAPIAAMVVASDVDVGQTIDPATVLFTLADLGQLIVETDVDEAYAVQIVVGQPAALQIVGESAVRSGEVSFVAPRVDEDTGALAVKLAFARAVTAPVGLTVTANITVDSQPAAISVPRAAVVIVGGRDVVFVLAENTVTLREVGIVAWPAARLMVTNGLVAGDVVIVDATGLVDGQRVTVAPAVAVAKAVAGD